MSIMERDWWAEGKPLRVKTSQAAGNGKKLATSGT